jgi:hypothetical protein
MAKGVGSLGLFKVTDYVEVKPEAVTTKDNLKASSSTHEMGGPYP